MAKPRTIKRKTHWRGKEEGLKHGVREVGYAGEMVHQDRAICGVKVTDDFTAVGTRLKKTDTKCAKCVRWDESGMGVGGPNAKVAKPKVETSTAEPVAA